MACYPGTIPSKTCLKLTARFSRSNVAWYDAWVMTWVTKIHRESKQCRLHVIWVQHNPPVITIFIGGMVPIPKWVVDSWFAHVISNVFIVVMDGWLDWTMHIISVFWLVSNMMTRIHCYLIVAWWLPKITMAKNGFVMSNILRIEKKKIPSAGLQLVETSQAKQL